MSHYRLRKVNAMKQDKDKLLPPWKEEPNYEPMVYRAKLINEISDWYYKKFKPGASDYVRVSVFDLIADFIIDTRTPNQTVEKGT